MTKYLVLYQQGLNYQVHELYTNSVLIPLASHFIPLKSKCCKFKMVEWTPSRSCRYMLKQLQI